jgi:hypothetical protein
MLTRTQFLALPPEKQTTIAHKMFGNLKDTYKAYNPLGGESNDLWMCEPLPGNELLRLDDGFVVWDTGNEILAVVASCYKRYDFLPCSNARYYPLAVPLTGG